MRRDSSPSVSEVPPIGLGRIVADRTRAFAIMALMKRALLLAAALAAGCGGSKSPESARKTEAVQTVEYFRVDPSTAAKVRGRILYEGPKPARRAIAMESDADCREAQAGKP